MRTTFQELTDVNDDEGIMRKCDEKAKEDNYTLTLGHYDHNGWMLEPDIKVDATVSRYARKQSIEDYGHDPCGDIVDRLVTQLKENIKSQPVEDKEPKILTELDKIKKATRDYSEESFTEMMTEFTNQYNKAIEDGYKIKYIDSMCFYYNEKPYVCNAQQLIKKEEIFKTLLRNRKKEDYIICIYGLANNPFANGYYILNAVVKEKKDDNK